MSTQPDPAALQLTVLCSLISDLIDEQRHSRRAQLAPSDRRTGAVLWPLVAELLGGQPFTAESLLRAAQNDRTTTGQAAREVLADLATDEGGLRAFGRLLARLDGVVLAGYRLVPAGEVSSGRRWRLTWVSDLE